MKIAAPQTVPVEVEQIRLAIRSWKEDKGTSTTKIPQNIRNMIRSLKGQYSGSQIAQMVGLCDASVWRILSESTKPKNLPVKQSKKIEVLKLAPIVIGPLKSSSKVSIELESPNGWKIKLQDDHDVKSLLRMVMEVTL